MVLNFQLPEFECPPVVETVLSVRFREAAGLTTARIIQFWEKHLLPDFPDVVEQPPYHPLIEQFGPDASFGRVELQLEAGIPSPRFWFTSPNGLVQLQPDWAAFNWRQGENSDDYLRYTNSRKQFEILLGKLERFVGEHDGKFDPVQCEVTYVNHILLEDTDLAIGPLGEVLQGVAATANSFLPAPDGAKYASNYLIHLDGESPVGRLHVIAESSRLEPGRRPVVVLNLTARGRPQGEGIQGVLAFCDLGRTWIVKGFKDLTTQPMHTKWKLKENQT